jgi:predicted NBD/HSP70 family sugar kinase
MYLIYDIGGTKTRVAFSADGSSFEDPKIVPTPSKFDEGIELFHSLADEVKKGRDVFDSAGGVSGTWNKDRTELVNSPNLIDWIGKPVKDKLSSVINAPTYCDNDCAMVGLGEALQGAGRGHSIVAYITVSTGVGGARIIDGIVDERSLSYEPGHQIIDMSIHDPEAGVLGTLEGLVSGTAIEKRFNMKPYEVKIDDLWENELSRKLAFGLNNTMVHWAPDVVVLGGSMIVGDPAISVTKTRDILSNILVAYPTVPEVKKAELDQVGGLFGALEYLKRKNKSL